jgi:multimeric flavodoxin WrbA
MLHTALEGARAAGAETEAVHLRDYHFFPCIGCERCRKDKACTGLKDGMHLIYPLVERAQGLVVACPAHNYNVTAIMKAFIDRLYCYYEFDNANRPGPWSSRLADQGRKAALLAVCEQMNEEEGLGFTVKGMRLPLEALGYEIADEVVSFGRFAKGAVKGDDEVLKRCAEVGGGLAG